MIRNGLSVIARRSGYQASVPLIGSQHQEFVQRSAFFERTGSLQVLQLEKNRTAGYAREFMGLRCRGNADARTNPAKCVLDVIECDHL